MHPDSRSLTSPRAMALLRLGTLLRARGYRFITPTPLTHERVNRRPGNEQAQDLRDIFGWSRPFRSDMLDQELFAAMQQAGVLDAGEDGWISQVRWSTLDDDLFVHSRFPTSAADAVFFGPDTYRFCRLIRDHLQQEQPSIRRVVDIGCGAGPGAITAAHRLPGAQVLALDINPQALMLTAVNAHLAGTDNVTAMHSDLLRDVDGCFDLILANPPYLLDPQRRTYRHGGGQHGAGLSLAIVDTALQRLAPAGTLLLYTGVAICAGHDPFLEAIRLSLEDTGWDWHYEELDPDVFGEELDTPAYTEVERIACVALRLTRAG